MSKTNAVQTLRLKDAKGEPEPGEFDVRITFRDRCYIDDLSMRQGLFEKCYDLCSRLVVTWRDVPGVPWTRDMDANLSALGRERMMRLASAIVEAGRLSENDSKN